MFLKLGILITLPLLVFGPFILKDGVVVVDVTKNREHSRIFIPVPVSLVNLGVKMIPQQHLDDHREQLMKCEPFIQAVSDQLMDMPDVTFVEVKSQREQVNLSKQGNDLVLDVNSRDENVHISIPIRGMKKVVQNLTEVAD